MSQPFGTADDCEAAFYAAFATTDVEAMELVWEEGDEAICIHPGGGLLLGKDAVMQSWAEILSGSAPPRLDYRIHRQIRAPDLHIHLVEESIRAGRNADASANLVLATNVYARSGDGWRLRIHHASLPLMPARGRAGVERSLH